MVRIPKPSLRLPRIRRRRGGKLTHSYTATLEASYLAGPRADLTAILKSLAPTLSIPINMLGDEKLYTEIRYTFRVVGALAPPLRGVLVVGTRRQVADALRKTRLALPRNPALSEKFTAVVTSAVQALNRFPRVIAIAGQIHPRASIPAIVRSPDKKLNSILEGNPRLSLEPILDAANNTWYGEAVEAPDLRADSRGSPATIYVAGVLDPDLSTWLVVANATSLASLLETRISYEEKLLEEAVRDAEAED